jgi:hypothetical protein
MNAFVLIEKLATKEYGRPFYFRKMTGIGPMNTSERQHAAEFDTLEAARACPTNFHVWSFYDVIHAEGVDAYVNRLISGGAA